MLSDATWVGSEREGADRRSGHDGALGRPSRGRLRRGRALRADPVSARQVRSLLHARGGAGSLLDGLRLAPPAVVRALVGPARRNLADPRRRGRRWHRDCACLRLAHLRAGRGLRDRRRAGHGGIPSRGVEVRRLRQRPQAGERDGVLLGRREPRVRPRRPRRRRARPLARPPRRPAARRPVPRRRGRPVLGARVPARLRSRPRDRTPRRR